MFGGHGKEEAALALRAALPYIRLYRGRTFVLKLGGAQAAEAGALLELAEQVSVLRELGLRCVIVHGGGPQTTALSRELGLTPRFVEGRRVTCPRTLEVAVLTINGGVNTAVLQACRKAQLPAVGISGVDGGLLRARRRPPVIRDLGHGPEEVDYGHVGDLIGVDDTVLQRLLDAGFVPVVSPLCADDDGQLLNVNADTVASTLACHLRAEKLIFLTDTPGLLEDRQDPGSLVSITDIVGLRAMVASGALDAGMLPKAQAAITALEQGVHRVHLVGYRGRGSLLVEIFTNEGAGTLIVREQADLLPGEQGPLAGQAPGPA